MNDGWINELNDSISSDNFHDFRKLRASSSRMRPRDFRIGTCIKAQRRGKHSCWQASWIRPTITPVIPSRWFHRRVDSSSEIPFNGISVTSCQQSSNENDEKNFEWNIEEIPRVLTSPIVAYFLCFSIVTGRSALRLKMKRQWNNWNSRIAYSRSYERHIFVDAKQSQPRCNCDATRRQSSGDLHCFNVIVSISSDAKARSIHVSRERAGQVPIERTSRKMSDESRNCNSYRCLNTIFLSQFYGSHLRWWK